MVRPDGDATVRTDNGPISCCAGRIAHPRLRRHRGSALGLNDRIACIGAAHGAKVAHAYPPFVGHGPIGDYFSDEVHPNGTGYQVLADLLQDVYEAP